MNTVEMRQLMPAIRAFYKIWSPISFQMDEAVYYDSQYDAGEWSYSLNFENECREQYRITKLVADRFNVSTEDLDDAINFNEYYTSSKWFDANADTIKPLNINL